MASLAQISRCAPSQGGSFHCKGRGAQKKSAGFCDFTVAAVSGAHIGSMTANPGAACDGAGRTFQRARHGSRHRPGSSGGDLLCARGAADKAVEVGAGGDVAGGERRDPDA
eukprot:scaffold59325_cov69-Phaeocystis_antarctica.AAC.5